MHFLNAIPWVKGSLYSTYISHAEHVPNLSCICRRLQYWKTADYKSLYIDAKINYVIIGEIIKTLSGDAWEDAMTLNVLNPLGNYNIVRCYFARLSSY